MSPIHQPSAGWNVICAYRDILGLHISAARAPKGRLCLDFFSFLAQFWANIAFSGNVGVCGVQIIATERPAYTVLIQPIWNQPGKEMVLARLLNSHNFFIKNLPNIRFFLDSQHPNISQTSLTDGIISVAL